MKKIKFRDLIVLICLALLVTEGIHRVWDDSSMRRLSAQTVMDERFRRQDAGALLPLLARTEDAGTLLALYWLDTDFGSQNTARWLRAETPGALTRQIQTVENKWRAHPDYPQYRSLCRAVWNDAVCFPVAVPKRSRKPFVTFQDSWMEPRTYGGKRGHEGTDLMAAKSVPGCCPIVSMTDGTVVRKGWLPQGGWRIGILAPGGAYFYYAHLDSYANVREGERIRAGDILGFMGDSGYGSEGTTGMFPVHLHLGVYLYPNGYPSEPEISVNPYFLLRCVEQKKFTYSECRTAA